MVRAPCCEKLDLKKGPWTADEDEILVAHIVKHGHGNWRALPKQAGLLRCGKSCRLRWMNYLRPDIKRGSFTVEEEEMIITMHENLGNKWSVIAAKLPGRTDNEIKNVWHTHLKKRLNPTAQESKNKRKRCNSKTKTVSKAKRSKLNKDAPVSTTDGDSMFSSPAVPSCSNFSCTTELYSITGETAADSGSKEQEGFSYDEFLEIDESFWTEELCVDSSLAAPELPGCDMALPNPVLETLSTFSSSESDVMDFWLDVFIESGGLQDFP